MWWPRATIGAGGGLRTGRDLARNGAKMDASRFVYPAETKKALEEAFAAMIEASAADDDGDARAKYEAAVEEHNRAKAFGFHRDPKDLTNEEVRNTIWANCWNEDGLLIRLSDLAARATWPEWQPEPPPESWIRRRDELIEQFVALSTSNRWAFDGLARLLVVLTERGDPIPDVLIRWVLRVAYHRFRGTSQVVEPPKTRGQQPRPDKHLRIWSAFRWLKGGGWSANRAYEEIAVALGESKVYIRRTCERWKPDH